MTKTEIIKEYLSFEGNKEKSMRVSIAEINSIYGVKISVGMFHKIKVNSEQESEQPKVNSEQPKVNSEQESEQPKVNSEQPKVNSEQESEQPKVNSEQPKVNSEQESEHPIGELTPELEMVLNRMGECTNLFDMVETIRQFDVYVQKNNVSIKHLLNKKLNELLDWQLRLVADYGLDERLCFTF